MTSSSETEDDEFFDTRDEVSSVSKACINGIIDGALSYDFWTKEPDSVHERRDNFFKLMGLSLDHHNKTDRYEEDDSILEELKRDSNRLMSDDEAVLVDSDYEPVENRKIRNLDNGTEFIVDKRNDDGSGTTFHESGSDKMISVHELQKTFGSSSTSPKSFSPKKVDETFGSSKKKLKSSWLQRFSAVAHIAGRTKGFMDKSNETHSKVGSRVRVRVSKKHSKELSALYAGQEFRAHEGSILTMKFSHDGRYLASGGVDGVVRVWNVLEDSDVNEVNACGLYFCVDHISKVAPVSVVKGNSRKSSDTAPVFPKRVFQLSEKPLHEFCGHEGEVLSLSWSKNGSLLSSSVDKTVRLWRVGNEHCIRAYSHNNYVTCVEFNPVDDNHFVSGSIDGKLRMWEIEYGRVVDWTNVKEIVTAVCYSPDGKGGIVGSMDGNCRFYEVIDGRFELGAEMCLTGKKKLPGGRRITGFQYCPGDVSKVMVSSADSQVRIICGAAVVCKFKGHRCPGATRSPASFTSNGDHVISIGEDSNVRVWTYTAVDQKSSRPENLRSCETFPSRSSSVAIPWTNLAGSLPGGGRLAENLPAATPDCFPSGLSFFLHKGSTAATWPEEKLPRLSSPPPESKSELKLLRNTWLSGPHLWGLVVVTAGWDGCIRTFLNYGLPIRF